MVPDAVPQELQYTEADIQRLSPRDHIRLRPGMYIGGTDAHALHHLIYEVVDNAIDEALAGRCDEIEVTLHEGNAVTIRDNGAGIPVGPHPELGVSTLQVVLTEFGAGGKFDNKAYKVSGGLHGVGVKAVNALTAALTAEVKRDKALWRQSYLEGEPVGEVEQVRRLKRGEATGTSIHFTPDYSILDDNAFDYEMLKARFREMAFVTRGVHITLRDERLQEPEQRLPRQVSFYFEGGIGSFVRHLNRGKASLHDPLYAERSIEYCPREDREPFQIGVEIALQYTTSASSQEFSFTNTINTPDGGTHITGLRSAVTSVLNRYALRKGMLKEKEPNFSGSDTMEGLTAIVSIKHPNPQFESQTKVKLLNTEVRSAVSQVVSELLSEYLELNSREARRIIQKCMTSQRAREAARKARELIRGGPSLLESTTLPGKLADCSVRGADAEIFIVEGDSAGGTAKQGRDRRFQAILPLRGKILNTERATMDRILDNNEVKAMISALGTGIGADFTLDRLRYGKVIIMTDADVDGSHIRTLLLTFFFRHMHPLVESGHLYIAQPPILGLSNGKATQYIYPQTGKTEDELLKGALRRYKNPDRVQVQRYKGLGEMNAEQLWDTTMHPEDRTLLQVNIEDSAKADQIFRTLMGAEVLPRRLFIQKNARFVRNLDT